MGVAVLIPVTLFVVVGFVAFAILHHGSRREARRIEMHSRILEKVGSAAEFGEFLGTDAGERFLQSLSPETSRPETRLLWSIRTGIVLLTVGIGMFIGIRSGTFAGEADDFGIVATIVTATGFGMVLSSAISYSVARRMGLLNQDNGRRVS